jgi:hypothetical protein
MDPSSIQTMLAGLIDDYSATKAANAQADTDAQVAMTAARASNASHDAAAAAQAKQDADCEAVETAIHATFHSAAAVVPPATPA